MNCAFCFDAHGKDAHDLQTKYGVGVHGVGVYGVGAYNGIYDVSRAANQIFEFSVAS